jgi:hypothetical protein
MSVQKKSNYSWLNKPQNLQYRYRVFETRGNLIGHLSALIIFDCSNQNQWVAVLSQFGVFRDMIPNINSELFSLPFFSDCEEGVFNRISLAFPECRFELQV